jgi:hypothetical protein
MTDRIALAARIEMAFPVGEFSPIESMLRHGDECSDCSLLAAELEQWGRLPITRAGLAIIARIQQHLTPKGWRWFVSKFLRDVVADENLSNRIEIESLIYFLSPSITAADAVRVVLCELTDRQLEVLLAFQGWLAMNDFWQDYLGRDIEAAVKFVNEFVAERH